MKTGQTKCFGCNSAYLNCYATCPHSPAKEGNTSTILTIADVIPRSEFERLTVELKSMRGAANAYKMHYERAKRDAEVLASELANISELGVDIKQTVAREIFEEIEKNIEKHYNRHIFGVEELSDVEQEAVMNFSNDVSSDLAELKKKYIGE